VVPYQVGLTRNQSELSPTPTSALTAGPAALLAPARMDGDEKQQDDWANSRKNRLPSFNEVLSRRTRPPVDLFMF
jgi:hypothetical protein